MVGEGKKKKRKKGRWNLLLYLKIKINNLIKSNYQMSPNVSEPLGFGGHCLCALKGPEGH